MKPFLKWAGGKYKLVDKIKEQLPKGGRLIEPFCGAGAVFLNTDFDCYLICDSNEDLINLYQYIQKHGSKFIDYVEKNYFNGQYISEASFYEQRLKFNTTQDVKEKSALFIYLNRHCFNGLCRYNSKGGFNVPFGRYKTPYFPREELECFYKQSKRNTVFKCQDFKDTMDAANKGDVVYADPPYAPVSITSSFTSYSTKGFVEDDQKALIAKAKELQEQGIPVLISNSDTAWTEQNYNLPKVKITNFEVRRLIAADSSKRNMAGEILALFK
ncbi:Dam family site-specific DNA-(adenine-N6)-methyltransferase [Methylophilaceae bacterium]|nr:Dam family site-specific DNA-(adenine-N6)-methyltransferase [Methylophilaceae bacterium]